MFGERHLASYLKGHLHSDWAVMLQDLLLDSWGVSASEFHLEKAILMCCFSTYRKVGTKCLAFG